MIGFRATLTPAIVSAAMLFLGAVIGFTVADNRAPALTAGNAPAGQTAPAKQSGDIRIMPDELVRYAHAKGCDQVSDFYLERPYIRQPPFVYEILLDPKRDDFYDDPTSVFWCEDKTKIRGPMDQRHFTLLLKLEDPDWEERERRWPGGCPPEITDEADVGGLTIVRNTDDELDRYYDTTTNTKLENVKKGQFITWPYIQSMWDGTGVRYYCHEGR